MTTDRTSRTVDDSRDEAAGKAEREICGLVLGVGERTAGAIYVVARVLAVDDRSVLYSRGRSVSGWSSIVLIGGETYAEGFFGPSPSRAAPV
jgi:hypothetical protein